MEKQEVPVTTPPAGFHVPASKQERLPKAKEVPATAAKVGFG